MWMTFVPSFLWVFLGGPYFESLSANKALNAALSAITAAVVGVILNLAVWLGLRTLFGQIETRQAGVLTLNLPILQSLNLPALILAVVAMAAIFRFQLGMLPVLAGSSLLGAVYYLATGAH
jgi:chromate transporter